MRAKGLTNLDVSGRFGWRSCVGLIPFSSSTWSLEVAMSQGVDSSLGKTMVSGRDQDGTPKGGVGQVGMAFGFHCFQWSLVAQSARHIPEFNNSTLQNRGLHGSSHLFYGN